ncbi:MAG: alanine racemase, partial [Oscillospiraceae bacterium]|nr:alanine racemase [Oscillospiraceae bacterium]
MEYRDIVTNVKNGIIQTPAYIFDMDILRTKVAMITEILSKTAKVCYAIKANPFIISAVDDMVPKYEVCSPGELEICKNSHIPMEKVVFSGVNKTAESIRTAAEYGVGVMTIESLHQFDLIAACAAERKQEIRIILRLTNGAQFGINEEDIEDLIARRAEFPYIHMLGVQYFTGTQKKKCDNIIHELDYAEAFCARLQEKYNYKMEQFEYGTGLWVPYFTKDNFENEFTDLIRIRDYFAEKKYPYEVILEMGRYPVASCGFFATKVEDCKTNKGSNYCLIDGGIHHINYYGQNMALKTPIIDQLPMHPVAETESKEWMMVGSLCTFNDVVARNFPVKDLQIGDYFIFHNIGAYSVTEGGYLFLSRDLPNIYFADDKNGIRLVRQGIPTHILSTPQLHAKRLDTPVMPGKKTETPVLSGAKKAETPVALKAAEAPTLSVRPVSEGKTVKAAAGVATVATMAAAAPVPVAPAKEVKEQRAKDAQAPRLNVPSSVDDGLDVPLVREKTAKPASQTNQSAGQTAKPAGQTTARTPKRFVPETDVINEAKRE